MTNLVNPTLLAPLATANDDVLIGTDFADVLSGGDGNDSIFGNAGRDWLDGDAGRDTVVGGAGGDLLYGWDGDDTLNGEAGDDFLFGEAGADTLVGGSGNDALAGGLGANVFVFGAGSGFDDILDFEPGVDKIAIVAGTAGIATAQGAFVHLSADVDGTAVLNLGDGNAVTLIGVSAAQITAGDFSILTA
ncbi:MAG TPA: M10 family metallopeptidase C-terminal domain-containing protein [Alphaproteobacteria bacterium]|nr:M10 family metallopeptidase C-terminal domain-containing protein [Alphaproteobacteria bacterium]